MAFFQERVWPTERPRRRSLPVTCTMLTESTCTFLLAKASSTAYLIWILLASGATSKTYLPCSPRTVLFSETTGRMMVLNASRRLIRRRPPQRVVGLSLTVLRLLLRPSLAARVVVAERTPRQECRHRFE